MRLLRFFIPWLFSTFLLEAQDISFRPSKINLPSKFVKEMRKSANFLWISSSAGLLRVELGSKKSKLYTTSDGLPDNYVTSCAVSLDEKTVWIGTPKGAARLNTATGKITVFSRRKKEISDDRVQAVLIDKDDVYVGTSLGVDRYDANTDKWKAYTAIEGLAGNDIQALALDGDLIWAAGADGISVYDRNEDFWRSFGNGEGLTSPLVTSLSVDSDSIWVGTVGGGLSRFDKTSERFENFTEDEGLVDDNVQVLIEDGIYLWIGTFNGISRLEKRTFIFKNFQAASGLKEPSVVAGTVTGNDIIVGTDGGGAYEGNKIIPEVAISRRSGYKKKRLIEFYADLDSSNKISRIDMKFRRTDNLNSPWIKTGLSIKQPGKGREVLAAELKTEGLEDGKYLMELSAEDGQARKNTASAVFIVDNTAPVLKLYFRPPGEGDRIVNINGRYEDFNLDKLTVLIGKRKIDDSQVLINAQQKTFRFPLSLGGPTAIQVIAEDIGRNSTTLNDEYVIDKTPPDLNLNAVDETKISGNIVTITGTVKDENIDQVIINPGQIPAELTPAGINEYTFAAKAAIKKEGKYVFQVTAFDKAGRKTAKKLEVKFFSDETIIEVAEEKISRFTLRDSVEISGNILGPLLKEFYVLKRGGKEGEKRINVEIDEKKGKSFNAKVPLSEGKNILRLVGIHANGDKAEVTYEIESSNREPEAKLNVTSRSFSNRNVKITGKFDKGIRRVLVNNKDAKMNYTDQTYETEINLKDGRNTLDVQTVDELGKVRKKKDVIFYDTDMPDLFIRSLPSQTGLDQIKFKGRVSDVSGFQVSVYPAGKIEYLSASGDFEGRLNLSRGANRIFFVAEDAAGNRIVKDYLIQQDPSFAKIEVGSGAENQAEIAALQREIDRLKKELASRGQGGGVLARISPGDIKSRLPGKPGLYLVPMAGKIRSYDTAAQMYLGTRSLGELVAGFNGTSAENLRQVLVPSPQLFFLLNRSRYRASYENIMRQSGTAYLKSKSLASVEKRVLKYLLRSRSLSSVREGSGYTLFKMKNGAGVIVSSGSPGAEKIRQQEGLKEVLVAQVSSRGIYYRTY